MICLAAFDERKLEQVKVKRGQWFYSFELFEQAGPFQFIVHSASVFCDNMSDRDLTHAEREDGAVCAIAHR